MSPWEVFQRHSDSCDRKKKKRKMEQETPFTSSSVEANLDAVCAEPEVLDLLFKCASVSSGAFAYASLRACHRCIPRYVGHAAAFSVGAVQSAAETFLVSQQMLSFLSHFLGVTSWQPF